MPLPNAAHSLLAKVAEESGDFTLVGLFVNPVTGEMGTFSSHALEPGVVLGFLQRGTATMLEAMQAGELEAVNESTGEATEDQANGGTYVN